MGKIKVVAHNMLTPFGWGSHDNFQHIRAGEIAIRQHKGKVWGVAEDFMGALTDVPLSASKARSMALACIQKTLKNLRFRLPSGGTLLVLSTTKGDGGPISAMAESLQRELGLRLAPMVVSNACTSGVCALIAAMRALQYGRCRYALVCGVEAQNRFIISGFQSFHALSPELCRPFSENRMGLNVGEAVATMLLTYSDEVCPNDWILESGAIRNDAFHISAPSHQGEGSFRALQYVMTGFSPTDLAFISVHGTATTFNDEMEAMAIHRAGFSDIPICSLKGYYGHTMGAAGVLETILSMEAVDAGIVPATMGYDGALGVSKPVSVCNEPRPIQKKAFVKLMSGFGGCNAALRLQKGGQQ